MGEVFYTTTGREQPIFDRQTITSKQELLTGGPSIKYNSTMAGFNYNAAAVVIVASRNFDYGRGYYKKGYPFFCRIHVAFLKTGLFVHPDKN